MLRSAVYLLYAVLAWNKWGLAESHDGTDSVCVSKDAPSQCGAFCLAALRPLIDKVAHNRLQIDGLAKAQEETKNYTMLLTRTVPKFQ